MPTMTEIAAEYRAAGWVPIRVHGGNKNPIGKEWQLHPPAPEQFCDGDNIGLLLGPSGNHVTDVDLDCEIAIQLAPAFLPPTKRISGHASAPRSHHWYISKPAPAHLEFRDIRDADGKQKKLVELRCGFGHQTIVPPSVAEGEERIWYEQEAPTTIEPATLQRSCQRLAAASLLAKHYPGIGSRHDLTLALSGYLLRNGWTLDEVLHFVVEVARAADDSEPTDREKNVHTTNERLAAGKTATGGVELRKLLGQEVMDKFSAWLGLDNPRVSVQEADWPEMLPLAPSMPPVDKFDLVFLPACLRPLVADVSERMQTPTDFAGATATVALASAVNRRAIMYPRERDHSWEVPLNLWGAIVAPPGAKKSPLIAAIMKPLITIETQWRTEHKHAVAAYELVHAREEIAREVQRRDFKKALQSDAYEPPLSMAEETKPPIQRRLLATDATFEALHGILAGNPAGITVVRDELVSWIGALDKQGREQERGFFLESWNGGGSFTVDRIVRGSVHVENCCVSLLGGLQPARIRDYLSDTVADHSGPQNDGLFQRFQIMVWPDMPSDWILVDREPDAMAITTVERVLFRLAHLPAENPLRLGFDSAAQACFNDWQATLERVILNPDKPQAVTAHLAKYRSLLPKLAALFELADAAAHHAFNPGVGIMPVSLSHIEQAIAYTNYLWSHALRVYGCAATQETSAAQELVKHITTGKLPSVFSVREVYHRHHWYALETPDKARAALRHLQDLNWVREVKSEREKGRPTETWEVNPACRKKDGEK